MPMFLQFAFATPFLHKAIKLIDKIIALSPQKEDINSSKYKIKHECAWQNSFFTQFNKLG